MPRGLYKRKAFDRSCNVFKIALARSDRCHHIILPLKDEKRDFEFCPLLPRVIARDLRKNRLIEKCMSRRVLCQVACGLAKTRWHAQSFMIGRMSAGLDFIVHCAATVKSFAIQSAGFGPILSSAPPSSSFYARSLDDKRRTLLRDLVSSRMFHLCRLPEALKKDMVLLMDSPNVVPKELATRMVLSLRKARAHTLCDFNPIPGQLFHRLALLRYRRVRFGPKSRHCRQNGLPRLNSGVKTWQYDPAAYYEKQYRVLHVVALIPID